MARRSKAQIRESYSKMLGKDLIAKLSDEQISIISKTYNSLDDKEGSDVDSRIVMGYNDTILHEMARDMIGEEEEDEENAIENIEAPSDEEIDKKIRDYQLEQRKKELNKEFREKFFKKKEEKEKEEEEDEDIPEGLDDLLGSVRDEPSPIEPKTTTIKSSAIVPANFLGEKYEKYRDELISSGTIDGEQLTSEERKEGFKKRNDKIDFEKFVESVLDRKKQFNSVSEDTSSSLTVIPERGNLDLTNFIDKDPKEEKENIDDILKGIDSIIETLKDDQKLQESSAEIERKKLQKEKRSKREEKLETKPTSPLLKAAEKVLAPVKSLFDRIIQFFTTIFLGRALIKLLDWYEKPENKEKVKSILRFLGDWWPAILGSYVLFGTQFGKFTRTILSTITKFSFRLLKKVIPGLIKAAAANPKTALAIGATAATAAGVYGIGKMLGKDKVVENETARADTSRQALEEAPSTKDKSAGEREALVQSTRLEDAGGGGTLNNMPNQFVDPLGLRQDPTGLGGIGMQAFDGGGEVNGKPGIDKNPAMLTKGEFVMSSGAVQKYGLDTMMAMNAAGGGNNMPKVINGVTYAEGGGLNGDPADFDPKKFFEGEGVETTKHIVHNDKSYVIRYNPVDNGKGIEIRQINKVVEHAGPLGVLAGKSDKLTGVGPSSKEWSEVVNSQAVKKNFATSTGGRSKTYSYPTISTHPQAEIGFYQGRSYQTNLAKFKELDVDEKQSQQLAARAATEFALGSKDGKSTVLPGSSDENAAPEYLKDVSVARGDQSVQQNKPESALEILTRFIMGGAAKKSEPEKNESGSPRGASIQTGPGYGSEGKKISGELGRYLKQRLKSPRDYSQIHRHPEHPPYSLSSGHSAKSYHYQGRALDIGAYTHEQGKILKVIEQFNKLKDVNPVELIDGTQDPAGHGDHVHVAYKRGGVVPDIIPGMGIDEEPARLTQGESVLQVGARERQISATGIDPLSFNTGPNANKPQVVRGTIHAERGGIIQPSPANLAQKSVTPKSITPLKKSKPKVSYVDAGSDMESSPPVHKGTPDVPYFSASSSDRKKANILGIINY